LRVRGTRPGERRAAQRQYELPPSNIDCHLIAPHRGRMGWKKDSMPHCRVSDLIHGVPSDRECLLLALNSRANRKSGSGRTCCIVAV
jgi:hypothetical protein